jgi:hypothetical protein
MISAKLQRTIQANQLDAFYPARLEEVAARASAVRI